MNHGRDTDDIQCTSTLMLHQHIKRLNMHTFVFSSSKEMLLTDCGFIKLLLVYLSKVYRVINTQPCVYHYLFTHLYKNDFWLTFASWFMSNISVPQAGMHVWRAGRSYHIQYVQQFTQFTWTLRKPVKPQRVIRALGTSLFGRRKKSSSDIFPSRVSKLRKVSFMIS